MEPDPVHRPALLRDPRAGRVRVVPRHLDRPAPRRVERLGLCRCPRRRRRPAASHLPRRCHRGGGLHHRRRRHRDGPPERRAPGRVLPVGPAASRDGRLRRPSSRSTRPAGSWVTTPAYSWRDAVGYAVGAGSSRRARRADPMEIVAAESTNLFIGSEEISAPGRPGRPARDAVGRREPARVRIEGRAPAAPRNRSRSARSAPGEEARLEIGVACRGRCGSGEQSRCGGRARGGSADRSATRSSSPSRSRAGGCS